MRIRAINFFILSMILILLGTANPLRLHVIANSDETIDQALKIKVRNAVLKSVESEMSNAKTISDAKQVLLRNASSLQNVAQNVLEKENANYDVHLIIGKSNFPDRTYGKLFYPAGKYDALRIVLGDGIGKNWWCVMYPPLCLGDMPQDESEQTTQEQGVEFVSVVSEWFE